MLITSSIQTNSSPLPLSSSFPILTSVTFRLIDITLDSPLETDRTDIYLTLTCSVMEEGAVRYAGVGRRRGFLVLEERSGEHRVDKI